MPGISFSSWNLHDIMSSSHKKNRKASDTNIMNTSSTAPPSQIGSPKMLPHLPDELWVKIWTFHASDWVNNGHFYIVDNGPYLVNLWRGCTSCQLPVGLGVSQFSRDIVLSVMRERGIHSWEEPGAPFDSWAHTGEKFTDWAAHRGEGGWASRLKYLAVAVIDFRTWAQSCDMEGAPMMSRVLFWQLVTPVVGQLHYPEVTGSS